MPIFFDDSLKPGPLLGKWAVFFTLLRRDQLAMATRGFWFVNDVSNVFSVTLSLLIVLGAMVDSPKAWRLVVSVYNLRLQPLKFWHLVHMQHWITHSSRHRKITDIDDGEAEHTEKVSAWATRKLCVIMERGKYWQKKPKEEISERSSENVWPRLGCGPFHQQRCLCHEI